MRLRDTISMWKEVPHDKITLATISSDNFFFQTMIIPILLLLYPPTELLICCPWSDAVPSCYYLLWYHCVWFSPWS